MLIKGRGVHKIIFAKIIIELLDKTRKISFDYQI